MRRILCDEHEFFDVHSEQFLELAIAAPSGYCRDLKALLENCEASGLSAEPPPHSWTRWSQVAEHLNQFAGLTLPHPTQLREAMMLRDEWHELEIGVAFGSALVWYHWTMSA